MSLDRFPERADPQLDHGHNCDHHAANNCDGPQDPTDEDNCLEESQNDIT